MTHLSFPHNAAKRVSYLENGDRLSRQEFERRYEATPHINKAELIEGTVYMARLLSGFKIMASLMQT